MIKVTYDPYYGAAVPDARAEIMVNEWVMHKQVEVVISSGLVVDWLRVAICEKKLNVKDIELYYKPKEGDLVKLTIQENGRLTNWPVGFHDYELHALERLI